jgi:predicted transcriptional regulator
LEVTLATLRDIREQYYISRRELGELAGVSESTIVRIEEASNRTTYDVARKIIGALSQRINKELSIDSIEGLNLYNPMRDRRLRTKRSKAEPSQAKVEPSLVA